MLHYETVDDRLLELLQSLMQEQAFEPYLLVGGTALALQISHRNSVDIDLFGNHEIKDVEFMELLGHNGDVSLLKKSKRILILSIDRIKVDIVDYKYPWFESKIISGWPPFRISEQ